MIRNTAVTIVACCAAPLFVNAQQVPCDQWVRFWDPGGGHSATGGIIAVAPDGSVYAAGRFGAQHDDIVLIKYDASGRTIWVTTYDGPGGGDDEPTDIEVTDEGVSIVGASLGERGPETVLLDYAADGTLIRERRTLGPAVAGIFQPQLAIGVDGRRVIGTDDGARSSVVEAYANDGSLLFQTAFSLEDFSGVTTLAVNDDLDAFVVMVEGFNRYVVHKLDATGRVQWSHDEAFAGLVESEAFIATIGTDVVVTGSGEPPCISPNVRVWRHAADGSVQWTRELPEECSFAVAVGLAEAPDEGVYLAVRAASPTSFLARLDANGNTVWLAPAGRDGSSIAFASLASTPAGNAIVGSTIAPEEAALELDVLVQNYDASGTLAWSTTLAGDADEVDFTNQVAAGADGTVAAIATVRQGVPVQSLATLGFPPAGCPGDLNSDGDVDIDDWPAFTACLTGPQDGAVEPTCAPADMDQDDDVDVADCALFYAVFGG